MTAAWNIAVSPVTFAPVLVLTVNGRKTNVEISIEATMDTSNGKTFIKTPDYFSNNDFMLMLFEKAHDLTNDELAEGYTELMKRLSK